MSKEPPKPGTGTKSVLSPPPVSPVRDTMGSGSELTEGTEPELNLSSFLSPPTSPDEIGWLAHYRVLQMVGRGGMGVVLRAEDIHLQRIVALKVILPEYAANPVARE